MNRIRILPGTVFLIPLDSSQYVGGIITHCGKESRRPILLASILLDRTFKEDVASTEILRHIVKGHCWIDRFGPEGFLIGHWKIVAQEVVPSSMASLPHVMVQPPNIGYRLSEADLVSNAGEVLIQKGQRYIFETMSGYRYVEGMLRRHFIENSIDLRKGYPSCI